MSTTSGAENLDTITGHKLWVKRNFPNPMLLRYLVDYMITHSM